jgi:hypothetical protein
MAPMINPFDVGGYTVAEMTTAINILPNVYTKQGELGLFRFEGVTRSLASIEQAEGVLTACSRRIVGWSMATSLATQLVLDALEMAVTTRRPKGVIHHSDSQSIGASSRAA